MNATLSGRNYGYEAFHAHHVQFCVPYNASQARRALAHEQGIEHNPRKHHPGMVRGQHRLLIDHVESQHKQMFGSAIDHHWRPVYTWTGERYGLDFHAAQVADLGKDAEAPEYSVGASDEDVDND